MSKAETPRSRSKKNLHKGSYYPHYLIFIEEKEKSSTKDSGRTTENYMTEEEVRAIIT
jgi:hypothetical protein